MYQRLEVVETGYSYTHVKSLDDVRRIVEDPFVSSRYWTVDCAGRFGMSPREAQIRVAVLPAAGYGPVSVQDFGTLDEAIEYLSR